MGTQGKKNTPITARVSTGLFNQKKGVTEPLLNVGQAGVHGNNQTRDIPSPSKMKGYAMKASPFKQRADELKDPVVTKATKTDIEVIDPVKISPNPRDGVTWSHPAFAGNRIYIRSDSRLVNILVK